jgi:hypothetical protein
MEGSIAPRGLACGNAVIAQGLAEHTDEVLDHRLRQHQLPAFVHERLFVTC